MLNKMDKLLFQKVCDEIVGQTQEQNGIGTLSEKTVHSVLKIIYHQIVYIMKEKWLALLQTFTMVMRLLKYKLGILIS